MLFNRVEYESKMDDILGDAAKLEKLPHADSFLTSVRLEDRINNFLRSFNPLTPRRTQVYPFTEISMLFKEGIIKKISYERCAYESVDEKSLSQVMSRKTTKKRIWSIKG